MLFFFLDLKKKKKEEVPVNGHPGKFQSAKQQSHAETDITATQELPNEPGSSHELPWL